MRTPTLETDRLLLRPFCREDAEAVFACWESDPDVAKYMFWTSHNDIQKTKEWISFELEQITSDDWFRWAVILKDTNELMGTGLIYFEEEYNLFEIGYNFGKQYWGKGYATETMQAIISFAKDILGVKELVGRYAKENSASGNVMKKLGFVYCHDIPYEANEGKVQYEGVEYRLVLK
ncbi:MAG: GNAT family N-acetyltransferase [Eubacterium sp.]